MAFWSENFAQGSLSDPTQPDVAATLASIVEAAGYAPPANANDLTSMSKSSSAKGLGTVIITQVDHDGKELEAWTLWNAFITDLKFGELSYGDEWETYSIMVEDINIIDLLSESQIGEIEEMILDKLN